MSNFGKAINEKLSIKKYNLLKKKALEDKLDNKIEIRGAVWMPELGFREKGDFFFICKKGDQIYEIAANLRIVVDWKDYLFPYSNISVKPLPEGINHLVRCNLSLTRFMVMPKPINTIPFQEKVMLEFDNTKLRDIAIQGGQGRWIVDLDKVEFFDL